MDSRPPPGHYDHCHYRTTGLLRTPFLLTLLLTETARSVTYHHPSLTRPPSRLTTTKQSRQNRAGKQGRAKSNRYAMPALFKPSSEPSFRFSSPTLTRKLTASQVFWWIPSGSIRAMSKRYPTPALSETTGKTLFSSLVPSSLWRRALPMLAGRLSRGYSGPMDRCEASISRQQ